MPSSIWTRCAGRSSLRPLSGRAWRVVESQHLFSTRKLVDSDEEQALLEELIEDVKPPAGAAAGLHYLLFTPFRYPPLRHGSGSAPAPRHGIWYGSRTQPPRSRRRRIPAPVPGGHDGGAHAAGDGRLDLPGRLRDAEGRGPPAAAPSRATRRSSRRRPTTSRRALGREMRADRVEAFLYTSAATRTRRQREALRARGPSVAASSTGELAAWSRTTSRSPRRTSSAPPPLRSSAACSKSTAACPRPRSRL